MIADSKPAEQALPPSEAAPATSRASWWQFSLRTMFILITLLVIGLAWFVDGPERERRIIAELREMGAQIDFEGVTQGSVPEQQAWLPLAYTHRVRLIFLFGHEDANAFLSVASRLRAFEELDLQSCKFTAEGLKSLESHPELRELRITFASLSDEAISHILKLPHLRRLSLISTNLSDAQLAKIARLSELEFLNLLSNPITDRGIESLVRCQKLTDLFLEETTVTDEGIARLPSLKKLERLELGSTEITVKGLAALATLPRLSILSVAQTRLRSIDMKHVAKFPSLTEINVRYAIGASGIRYLESLGKKVSFAGTQLYYSESPDEMIDFPGRSP